MSAQKDTQDYINSGLKFLQKGEVSEAEKQFREAIKIEKNARILSLLGLSIAQNGGNTEEAEELCKEAISIRPRIGEYYLNMSKVYSLQKKKAESIDTLKKGLEMDKGNYDLLAEMKKYGIRKRPAIPFLSRSSLANREIGRLVSKFLPK